MQPRFQRRAAIVTGAGSGIGRAIALRLHDEGARVLAVDIDGDRLAALPRGDDFAIFHADVTEAGAPQAIADECLRQFGGIRVLVNNAGLGNCPPFHESTDAVYEKFIAINQDATFKMTRAALPALLADGGVILNIVSSLALQGYRRSAVYTLAKAGVAGLTRNLAADYADQGIRVNAIAPGVIATALTEGRLQTARFQAAIVATTPMGRPGLPEEVAGAAAFLCSDDAGFVTGQVLAVDGGQTSSAFISDEMVACWARAHPDS